MLEIKNVVSGYGELTVLKSVSLTVEPGKIVALIGPNGAGKSTVIKSVFSLASVTSGSITFGDVDITNVKTHELIEYGIAYVNQGKIIFGELSVEENLLVGGDVHKDKSVVSSLLSGVYKRFPALHEKREVLAYTLSGGQRQMLALGRALMQQPKLLLMDEPSLGLAPKLQKELFEMIASLRSEGISVLVVEQNAKKAIEIADTTYLLENGSVVLSGGKEILKDERIKQVYLGGQ